MKQRREIVMTTTPENWELMKSGKQTIIIRKTRPEALFFPFIVYVYVTGGVGVCGKFTCNQITRTIRPEQFAGVGKSCRKKDDLINYCRSAKGGICGWYIEPESLVVYDDPIPIYEYTGKKNPPYSWQYINGNDET